MNPELLAHIGQQTGSELLFQVLHNGETLAEVNRTVTAGAAFRTPAVRELVPFCDRLQLSEELATLHLPIVEHFCSILKREGVLRAHANYEGRRDGRDRARPRLPPLHALRAQRLGGRGGLLQQPRGGVAVDGLGCV